MGSAMHEPKELGFDRDRLARIPAYFDEHYVKPGKLAGALTVVSRGGQVSAFECRGRRDVARDVPLTAQHLPLTARPVSILRSCSNHHRDKPQYSSASIACAMAVLT